jgi:hypothetical protein
VSTCTDHTDIFRGAAQVWKDALGNWGESNGRNFAGFREYGYQGVFLTCYDGDSWNPKVAHGALMIWSSEEGSEESKQGNWATVGYSQSNRDNNIERHQIHLVHDPNFNGDPKFLHFLAAHEVRQIYMNNVEDIH